MGPLDLLPEAEGPLGAFVELHNLIAAAESPADFSAADRDRIARERGVDLKTAFRDERLGVYAVLFGDAREALTPETVRALGAVARTLALDPADVQTVHARAFGDATEAALGDGRLTPEERLTLHAFHQTLGLDDATGAAVLDVTARQHLTETVARVLTDGRLSPAEAAEVAAAAEALGGAVPADVAAMLDHAGSAWSDAAPLPTIVTGVPLSDHELAYADVAARWVSARPDALKHAIGSGIWDLPLADISFPWAPVVSHVRTGRLVVTDYRLIVFDEALPLRTIPLATIAEVAVFADALVLRLTNDSLRLLIGTGNEAEPFACVLRSAIRARPDRQPDLPPPSARWHELPPRPVPGEPAQPGSRALDWEVPGRASVTAGVLQLANVLGVHALPVPAIAETFQTGALVSLREATGIGFAVRFDDELDALALVAAVQAGWEHHGARAR